MFSFSFCADASVKYFFRPANRLAISCYAPVQSLRVCEFCCAADQNVVTPYYVSCFRFMVVLHGLVLIASTRLENNSGTKSNRLTELGTSDYFDTYKVYWAGIQSKHINF